MAVCFQSQLLTIPLYLLYPLFSHHFNGVQLSINNCFPYWIQIGTAFEYDLSGDAIDERTACLPKTHYGISKLMMSNFLQSQAMKNNFTILRPFGMFGKYEDGSKFFPYLINAQKTKRTIDLSPGTQQRDYFYVKDLGIFIKDILLRKTYTQLPQVMNLGSREAISFRDYASILQDEIPAFDPALWNWGKVAFRKGESAMFYSASTIGSSFGFKVSPLKDGFKETADYYLNIG